jgi:hypothetical protein
MTLINPSKGLVDHESATKMNAQELAGFTRAEVEALVRFAAEFLCRIKHNPATSEGLEEAYLRTIPIEYGHEEVHFYMQDLGELVRDALRESFRTWVGHEVSDDQRTREIADVKSALARLSPVEHTEQYNLLFRDLVALEQARKQTSAAQRRAPRQRAG